MKPRDFIEAARVPESLETQSFGLWQIARVSAFSLLDPVAQIRFVREVGFISYTLLRRASWRSLHLAQGEVVMEDSLSELRRHLPIWLHARGRVLVTGLGLGCVVRGLLASKRVEHITVIEIDRDILRIIGNEFQSNSRVRLIQGDALEISLAGETFDYAWHDLWTDGNKNLHILHAQLFSRFRRQVAKQGAWQFPKTFKRIMPEWFLK